MSERVITSGKGKQSQRDESMEPEACDEMAAGVVGEVMSTIVRYGDNNKNSLYPYLPIILLIQIIHSSEGISKNYPYKVPLEQSNTPADYLS